LLLPVPPTPLIISGLTRRAISNNIPNPVAIEIGQPGPEKKKAIRKAIPPAKCPNFLET
jgi:hypothetical protein